jgi:SAM-dependent methyltransferase
MLGKLKNIIKNKLRRFLGINDLMDILYMENSSGGIQAESLVKYRNFFQTIQNDCELLRQDSNVLTSKDIELMNDHSNDISSNSYFNVHKKRLIYTFNILRSLELSQNNNYIVDMGSWIAYVPVLQDIFTKFDFLLFVSNDLNTQADKLKYPNIQFASIDFESEKIPLPDNSASLILLLEVIEHFGQDPMFVMSEINRVLVDGGKVLISTPNLASWRALTAALTHYSPYTYGKYLPGVPHGRHIHEYVPRDVNILLASAGFKASVWTENVYHTGNSPKLIELLKELNLPTGDRGDTIFAVGTKIGGIQERYPIDLYDV